ncbi:MAG: DUF4369 domain-containing protein [Marinilabiliaceae bacterium]
MKIVVFFAAMVMVLGLSSCQQDKRFVIDGSVYGGRNFEDQTVYLTPLTATSVHEVSDSAVIHDGRFRFEGDAEHDGVYVLRMRPMMKLFIGEPFIIKEPGHITVRLSQVSSVSGTPQNDSLQAWCEFKAHVDSIMTETKRQQKRACPSDFDALAQKRDSVKAVFETRCRAIVNANNNAFGDFVDKWYVR